MADKLTSAPQAIMEQEYKLDYLREMLQEGDAFLRAQTGYGKMTDTLNAIMGENKPIRPRDFSVSACNEIGRIATVQAAYLADIKWFWEYRTSNNNFKNQARVLGQLATEWYTGKQINQKFGMVTKYALLAGSGIGHMVWNPAPDFSDVDLVPEDPRDVLPIRPASYLSFQDAFGVIIRKERTINYVKARWPHAAAYIRPDRDGSAAAQSEQTRIGKFLSAINKSPYDSYRANWGKPMAAIGGKMPVVDVFTMYLRDDACNTSNNTVYMGDWDMKFDPPIALNNWSYKVPKGAPLYPLGRMIIFTRTAVLYDGPNIYWHGRFPVAKLTLDPWPSTWLGKSPLWDLLPMQESLDNLMRAIDDHVQKVLRPHVIADKGFVSEAEMSKIDPRRPGQRWRKQAGGQIEVVDIPNLDPIVQWYVTFLIDRMNTMAGSQDMTAMMQKGQIPEGDTIEQMIAAMTPALRGMSQNIETFIGEVAEMAAYNFAQFYDVRRRFEILGPDGLTAQDFDFDPDSLIPDNTLSDYSSSGNNLTGVDNPRPRMDRAREAMRGLRFYVAPGTLLNGAEARMQMMYLQLFRDGALDVYTLLSKMNVENLGPEPPGTVIERLTMQNAMSMGPAPRVGHPPSAQSPPQMRDDGRVSESE